MSNRKVGVIPLIDNVTAISNGRQVEPWHTNRTFEAYGTTSAGVGAAEIAIEVRNSENSEWLLMGSITLTLGTTVTSDGFTSNRAWRYVRARVDSISGTDATVSANMGTAPL